MPFHFSLESVLRARLAQERNERLKLDAIVAVQARMQMQLEQVSETHFQLRRGFQQEMKNGLAGAELRFEFARESKLEMYRAGLRRNLENLEAQRVAQMKIFLKARQNREVLESLRQQKFNLYRIELGRREQQELDDLFGIRLASLIEE